jgi:ATPase subunit of ABC transporter with duplicated ATPase domains
MAVLRQDQFAFDEVTVLNTVLMGHQKMWNTMLEKDAIYMK